MSYFVASQFGQELNFCHSVHVIGLYLRVPSKHKRSVCECQRSAVGCLKENKSKKGSKSKKGHHSEKKKMHCSLDSEHILQVSSKYLSNNRDITQLQSQKRGVILKKKNAFLIVSLDSMDCSLDSDHILPSYQYMLI